MSSKSSLAAAGILWALIYGVSLYLIPALPRMRALRDACPQIGAGDITQFCFLILSMAAIWIIGRGRFGPFGFKLTRPVALIKPVLISAGLSAALFIAGIVAMSIIGGAGTSDGNPEAAGTMRKMMPNFAKTVISIWIIASICEEIFYRGLFQTLLEPLRPLGVAIGKIRLSLPVLISGLVFGLGHLCLLRMFGGIFLVQIVVSCCAVGIVAAYYREKTGSLAPAIAAHMAANIVGYGIPQLLMHIASLAQAGG